MADRQQSGYIEEEGAYRSTKDPVNIPSYPHLGLATFLFQGPLSDPSNSSKPLLIDSSTGFTITCKEFERLVRAVASGFYTLLGVKQGDVILLLLNNTIYFPVIFHGIASMGAVVTTCNPANTQSEVERQFRDSGAEFVVTMPELLSKLENMSISGLVLLQDHDQTVQIPQWITNYVPFKALLNFSGPPPTNTVRIRQSDPAAILYSSGTTGASKGVVLSHGNIISAVLILTQGADATGRVSFILIPLFHVAGFVYLGCVMIYSASTLVVLPRFDLIEMLSAIQRYKVTSLPLVPPIVVALLKHPAVQKYNLTSVVSGGSGAAPLGKDTLEAFLAKFPHIQEFAQAYGMTETTGVGTNGVAPFGSAGTLAANHEAKVVDIQTGKALPPNTSGELWLRGPCIMQAYLNKPVATAETIDDQGWLHTGDVVYFDNNGYLYVVDRIKELIKYKGFQVPPAELEALLLNHPDIADAAVIPFPDEDAGEIPLACIVPREGTQISENDVMVFVARQVAPQKKVRKVVFLKEIPKSPSGKILRKNLIQSVTSRSKL